MKTIAKKSDYELKQFIGGYFGICEKGTHGGNCVFGGDSAHEDDYDKDFMVDVFENWNGELIENRIEL